MRCFIGVGLPREIKDYLEKVQKKFGATRGVSWVPKENMHITLAFLGEIDEDGLRNAMRSVEETAENFRAFQCSLGKLEAIPDRMPRLIWVSVVDGKKLGELHNALKSALGFEERGFSGHITLARIKTAEASKEISGKAEKLEISPVAFEVNSIDVMRSTLMPQGAVYSVIKAVKLTA